MRRLALLAAVAVLAPGAASSDAFAWGHGWHRGPRVFIGVGPYAPVWAPYWAPYPVYPYPPPPPYQGPPPSDPPSDEPDDAATYGLVQLRGVPDGADIDLDGRFWLRAQRLDERWLALPEGTHRLVVRVNGADPVERRVQIAAGRSQVVRVPRPPA